jgi:ribosomal-protein-alanine N-acetyltransferase
VTPDEIAAIHAAAFEGSEAWDGAAIRQLLDRPGTLAVTRRPHAFALLQILPPDAELLTIAVHPSAQGGGLGAALLDRLIAQARMKDCNKLYLEVAADNAPALALYARAGFSETGRRRGYYTRASGTRADALTMALSLDAQHSSNARAN